MKRATFLISASLLAVTFAAPAAAQTDPAAPAATPTSTTPDEAIVVTGTRVVRDGYEAPTPLTVMTAEEIQNSSPTNNIADVVNQLPSMAGSTKPANSRLNLSSGQAGINALNLRNLGEIRTLVLLDGRRSVGSTITGLVDINTIPQMLVQRVDVVTGGASAAYGSDAVAGVVNFILDTKYEGLKVKGDVGVTDYGDGFNYSFGAAGGMSFAGGRGHVLLSGEYAHTDGIFEVDRPWNHTGYVRIQNPAYNATTNSSVPQFLIRTQVGAANSTPGGLILASAGGTANRLRGLYFGDGGQVLRYQYGDLTYPSPTGASAPTLTQGGDWRVNDSGRRIGLAPRDNRYGFFGRLSYEISDGIELFAEAAYNKQRIFFNAGPNLSSCTTASTGNIGSGASGACTLSPNNAYLIQALGSAQLAGITAVGIGTTAVDLPFRAVDNRRKVQRYTVGAQGDLGLFDKAAPWNIYLQYGRADLREQLRNIMHTQHMANAVNAVFSVAGNTASPIVCAINADANTANDDPSCVPLNRLGIGVANPAAIDYVLGDPYRDEKIEQKVAGINLSMVPFATWAGDVSIAVGGEYREEKISGFVPTEFQPSITANPSGGVTTINTWSVGNYLPTNGKYNVKEAYLETVVPLGFGLEFNGAVRATDYSTSGYVTTWKAGATWQPIDDFRLRITRSRDIRAPNLNELYAAGSSNSDAVRNPFYDTLAPLNGVVYNTASLSYSATVTGNLNLKPEKADSWNIGGVLTPSFIPGFSFSADYFDIDISDAIGSLSAQEIINRCFEGRTEYCAAITQDPNSPTRILFRSQPFNFANQKVRGIDFETSYRVPLDKIFGNANGSLTLRGMATRYIENRVDQGIANTLVFNTVGANGGQFSTPKWLYRASLAYDSDHFGATLVGRGVSAGKYVANGIECQTNCPVSTTQQPTYDVNHIKGTFYTDLNLTAKIDIADDRQGELFLNVTNLFNKGAMLLPETGLAANSTFSDLLGRAYRVGFRMKLR